MQALDVSERLRLSELDRQRAQAATHRRQSWRANQQLITYLLPSGHVQVQIRDNGPGIPEAVRAIIFQPFFTTKVASKGTGLGLSLAHDILVRSHDGTHYRRHRRKSIHRVYCLPARARGLAKISPTVMLQLVYPFYSIGFPAPFRSGGRGVKRWTQRKGDITNLLY